MTLVDWIIVIVLVAAVLGGMSRGFFRSAFSLGGLILGLALAAWNYGRIAVPLRHLLRSQEVADVVAFLLIAILVMVTAAIVGEILAKLFQKVGLGCLDRLAGAFFGFFEGVLLVTVCILVTVAFLPKTQWLTQSTLTPYFFGPLHLSTHVTPQGLADRVKKELRRLEHESPPWMHPGKSE